MALICRFVLLSVALADTSIAGHISRSRPRLGLSRKGFGSTERELSGDSIDSPKPQDSDKEDLSSEATRRLLLIRHGEKDRYRPPVDWQWSLSEFGGTQAQSVASRLAAEFANYPDVPILLVSPFLRTVQTVTPIAKKLGILAQLEPGLGEARQAQNARSMIPANGRVPQLLEKDPALEPSLLDDTSDAMVTPVIPESGEDYVDRVLQMARVLHTWPGDTDIIVVTHASVVAGVTLALTDCPLEEIGDLHEASVMVLSNNGEGKWSITENASTAHLPKLGWDGYRAADSYTWSTFVNQRGRGPFV